jgi:hypothetical protein
VEAGALLDLAQARQALARGPRVLGVAGVDAERAAVGPELLDVEDAQAVARKMRSTATSEK